MTERLAEQHRRRRPGGTRLMCKKIELADADASPSALVRHCGRVGIAFDGFMGVDLGVPHLN
jgi:hypothetical protein